jgi:hypothetical protein
VALPEDQKDRLRCYANALNNSSFSGYVQFEERVLRWLRDELGQYTVRDICRMLTEHVQNGGRIQEVREAREEYVHNEFHYDLRIEIDNRRIYFETILLCDDPDDPDSPRIEVVNVHDV